MTATRKNVVIITVLFLLVVLGLFLITKNQTNSPADTSGNTTEDVTKDWLTSNLGNGITFKYPKDLNSDYISTVNWPPVVQITNGPYSCNESGSETAEAGITEKTNINGVEYCSTKKSEGAAGSTYTKYTYTFQKEDKVLTMTFTLRLVNCGNYPDPQMSQCQAERDTFNVDNLAAQMSETLILSPLVTSNSGATAHGTINGKVMLGPTCPVERNPPDPNCADKPYAGNFVLLSASTNKVVKSFNSNESGIFSIEALPGDYIIHQNSQATLPRCADSDVIKVEDRKIVQVTISCDSGIR